MWMKLGELIKGFQIKICTVVTFFSGLGNLKRFQKDYNFFAYKQNKERKNLTGCTSKKNWCFSLSGFIPWTASMKDEFAWRKWGHERTMGAPMIFGHLEMENIPSPITSHKGSSSQKQALDGSDLSKKYDVKTNSKQMLHYFLFPNVVIRRSIAF